MRPGNIASGGTCSRVFGFALALGLGALGPQACGSDAETGGASVGPTARFKLAGDTPPSFLEVPFPTDAYLRNGKLVDPLPGVDTFVPRNAAFLLRELAAADGFSRSGFAVFLVDDPRKPIADDGGPGYADIDPASLPANETACIADTSSVFLIDLAATDPSAARVRCRGALHDDTLTSDARPVVGVGPGLGVVLEEGHAYAAVLTSRVRDKKGAHLAASADFRALTSGARAGALGALYGGAIDKAKAALGKALATDGAEIVAIAPYTTNRASKELFKLREALEDLPVPKLAWDAASVAPMGAARFAAPVNGALPAGFTASLDAWLGVAPKLPDGSDDPDFEVTKVQQHDKIAAVGTAVFTAANYLVSKPGGYDELGHATFARDAAGAIVPAPDRPTTPIWVSLAVPTAPMPPGGYPCVIVAHGNPGSRAEAFMVLANTFAAKGWVVAGIDVVTQGARAPQAKFQVDQHTDWEALPGVTYKGPDGLADNLDAAGQPASVGARADGASLVGLGLNFGAARDQTRQAVIDISQLVRVLASDPDLSPLQTGAVAPRVDPARLAYVGGSFGAVTGAVAAALEPKVQHWVLNVVGGSSLAGAGHAPETQYILGAALALQFGITGQFVDETSPAGVLAEIAYEPSETMTFASYLVKSPGSIKGVALRPRNVLATEVLYDEVLGNDGTEAFARAAGLGLAMPNVGTNSGMTTLELVRAPSLLPDPLPLPNVNPDGNQLIHDTPIAGVTAVLVQVSPGRHYGNLLSAHGPRHYALPFSGTPRQLSADKQYLVRNSYLEQRAMVARFLDDAFRGLVPNVTGFKAPVRDVDDDGTPDATDPDPSDPTVK